jgi:hypothetical protein
VSRSPLLEKLRHACRLATGPDLPAAIPAFPEYDDKVDKFRAELERVSGVFYDGRPTDGLRQALQLVLQNSGASEIYWESEDVLLKHAIPYELRHPEAFAAGHVVFSSHHRREVRFPLMLDFKSYSRESVATVPLSVSSAARGIAETGTIVHQVDLGTGRMLSVLPPAHLVLLSESNLLSNVAEACEDQALGENGSLVTFATGPSRTADIEKTLVLGVHGPHRWYVVLTD